MRGTVLQISTSDGGVPKLAIGRAYLTTEGLLGDRQRNTEFHGGPERALCLYSREVIDALRTEGHGIVPGGAGENVTLQGVDWSTMVPGARVVFAGGVEVELTRFTVPCRNIAFNFHDGRFSRISQKVRPGWSRIYARVLREGWIETGEKVEVAAPDPSFIPSPE